MSSTEIGADVDVNVFTTPEGIRDPFPYYDRFRPMSPVPGYVDWSPGTVPGIDPPYTAWALFTYEQVLHVLRNPQIFSNRDPHQEESAAPSLMLEGHDDPEHARLRKLVSQAFTPRRIARLGPFLETEIAAALDGLGEGSFDACEVLSPVLPTRSMGRLLGLPGVSFETLAGWANAFMQSAPLSPEERQARCVEIMQVVTQTVLARKEALQGSDEVVALEDVDLITALLLANEAGETELAPTDLGRGAHSGRPGLTPEDIVLFVTTLLVAGNETTISLSSHCLNVLARQPEAQAALRADRSLMNDFIDETMRLYGSGQRLFKWVLEDTEIDGHRVAKDEWVAIFLLAANRDPAVFGDPRLRHGPAQPAPAPVLRAWHPLLPGRLAGPPQCGHARQRRPRSLLEDHADRRAPHGGDGEQLHPCPLEAPARAPPLTPGRSAGSERNIAVTKAIYEAVPRGDAATVFASVDPEIHVIYYGDEHVPYAGEYKGTEGLTEFLTKVAGAVVVEKMEPKLFIAEGDNLAVWGHQWFRTAKGGRAFDTDFAHIITLRDGKWLFFRDFANSAQASGVFRSE